MIGSSKDTHLENLKNSNEISYVFNATTKRFTFKQFRYLIQINDCKESFLHIVCDMNSIYYAFIRISREALVNLLGVQHNCKAFNAFYTRRTNLCALTLFIHLFAYMLLM